MVIDPALRVPPSQLAKAPSVVQPAPALISLNVQVPTPAVTHTPSQMPISSAVAHTPSQALPPSEVDMHANPRYLSQLPPVFTQCYAEQEQQLKAMEHQAAKQHNLEHCIKNTVEVYGWSKDGAEVTMYEFQEGITLLQFKLSSVYADYGVTITPEFNNIFASDSFHVVLNICTNLKAEHAAICLSNTCTQLRAASIAASNSEDPEDMWKRKHSGHSLQGNTRRMHTKTAGSLAGHPYSPALVIKHECTLLTPCWSFPPPLVIKCEVDAKLQDVIELFSDSGSEVNVTDVTLCQHVPHPSQCHSPSLDSSRSDSGSEVDVTDVTPRQHVPHLSRCHSPSSDSSQSTSSDSGNLSDPSTVSECLLLSSGHSPKDAVNVDAFNDVKCWPTSFYACEIADSFKKYNKSCRVGLSSHAVFSLAFREGVHFCPSTFSEHRKQWDHAPASSRTIFIQADKSDAGSYPAFMKANPLPGADVKAAKQCLGRLQG
ncbi:hypothetical protein BDR03DRAFT_1015477 [Suillus americanus]|nr:hypothetical protein BDR03DRAFT_1015477 [Suillus americanus]